MRISGARHPSGSPASPGMGFSADPDTGFYWALAPGIYMSVGGVTLAHLRGVEGATPSMTLLVPLHAPDGSAAAPGIAFDDDEDTGLARPGVGQVDIIGDATRILRLIAFAGDVDRWVMETGSAPFPLLLYAAGADADIDIEIQAKGAGDARLVGNPVDLVVGSTTRIRASAGAAGETDMEVRDVTGAALRRVSIGAADSGGLGFRVLRIPN